MKIYIVFGGTGEYSDHQTWMVKAFRDEDQAKALVENASWAANAIDAVRENRYDSPNGANPYDPDMYMDYTGTSYYIESVELEEVALEKDVD